MKWLRAVLIVGPIVLLVTIGFVLFPAAGRDDAHITYWPAHALARSGQIINYNGDPVEQSSSLLHVFVLGAASFVTGVPLPTLGPLLGIACGILGLICTWKLNKRVTADVPPYAPLFVGLSVYYIYWSFGALETSLAATCGLLLTLAYSNLLDEGPSWKTVPVCAAATLCYVLVRPEAALVLTAMLSLCLAVEFVGRRQAPAGLPAHRDNWMPRLLLAAIITVAALMAVAGLRLLYFHSLFPQPVYAKAQGVSLETLYLGLGYVKGVTLKPDMILLVALCAFGVVTTLLTRVRGQAVSTASFLSASLVICYVLFLSASGGDWMEGGRFFVHVLPAVMVMASVALVRIPPVWRNIAVMILCGMQLVGIIQFARQSSNAIPLLDQDATRLKEDTDQFTWFELHNMDHLSDIPTVNRLQALTGKLLQRRSGPVYVMSGQQGMVVYHLCRQYFGRIRIIDRVALVERTFTENPVTANLKRRRLGLSHSWKFFFAHRAELEASGVPRPDLLFDLDLDEDREHDFKSAGYTILYRQDGVVSSHSFLGNTRRRANEFIAVRSDLLPLLGRASEERVDFQELQR